MVVTFAKGAAPKAGGKAGKPGLGEAIVGAVTGATGNCGNGTVGGRKGFQPNNKCAGQGQGSRNTATHVASRAHASARRTVSAHVKKGTLNTPEGRAAIRASAAAARTLQAARATKRTEYAAAAKTTAATPKAQATTQLKAAHAAANPQKAAPAAAKPAPRPAPSRKDEVVAASKEATDIKAKVAAGHLGDLKGGSATDKAVDKLARGHTKDELFAVARNAGIEHKATTKKALVDHLKAHFAATAKLSEAPKAPAPPPKAGPAKAPTPKSRGTPDQRAAAATARAEARTRTAEVEKRKLIHDKGGVNKAITPEQVKQARRHDRTTERAARRTAQIEQARKDLNRAASRKKKGDKS